MFGTFIPNIRSVCVSRKYMAEVKVGHEQLISGFMEVFRKVGYEGASLEALAAASGLRKSSLYHRFPGGKKHMAEEVLKSANQWVRTNITSVLNSDGDPTKRLNRALKNIDILYSSGRKACILRALSMDTGLDLFSRLIHGAFEDWITGFSKIAMDFAFTSDESKQLGVDVVIKIQGSLIVSRGTGDKQLFKRTLKEIRTSLTKVA